MSRRLVMGKRIKKRKSETWVAAGPRVEDLQREIEHLRKSLEQRDALVTELLGLKPEEPAEEWERLESRADAMRIISKPPEDVGPIEWYPLTTVIELLDTRTWDWLQDTETKYLEIRIDTRDNHCLLFGGNIMPAQMQEGGIVRRLLARDEAELREYFAGREKAHQKLP